MSAIRPSRAEAPPTPTPRSSFDGLTSSPSHQALQVGRGILTVGTFFLPFIAWGYTRGVDLDYTCNSYYLMVGIPRFSFDEMEYPWTTHSARL